MAKAKNNFYAVKKGNTVGIFSTWAECHSSIHGCKGAMYKGFVTREEAEEYMNKQESKESKRHLTVDSVFTEIKENEMYSYVDGSNLGDGSKFSYASIVFYKKDGENVKTEVSGVNPNDRFVSFRNVAGELFASVKTVEFAIKLGLDKVYICHDYSGIRHWALGEWKTNNYLSESYKAFFDNALKHIKVEFVKADGHTGDKFNEEADVLAKKELGITKKK